MIAFLIDNAADQKEKQRITGAKRMDTERRNDIFDGNATEVVNEYVDRITEKELSEFFR